MEEEEEMRFARHVINKKLQTDLPMDLNLLVIRSIKMTRQRIFWPFFISFFPTIVLLVYTERIFPSVFTDGFNERIFNR